MRERNKLVWGKVIGLITLWYCMAPALPVLAHEHGGDVTTNKNGELPSSLTMNTSVISLIFVVFVILLLIVRLRKQGSTISTMTGMMATMTTAMLSSLVVGTIAGLWLERLFLSAVIGVMFGLVVGYILGLSLSLLASMDGMLSGIMGGMMGAMFGVMVTMDYPTLSVVLVDLVFAVSMFLLYKLLETEETASKKDNT